MAITKAFSWIFSMTFLLLTATSSPALAWQLNSASSTVNFVTIKKGNIAETHSFSALSGTIIDDKANLIIELSSIDTAVPIRDQRMRDYLFETELFPTAEVKVELSDSMSNLSTNSTQDMTLPGILSLHGLSNEIELKARVTQLNNNQLLVTSIKPVLIKATSFKLVEGIQKLSSLVNGLPIAEMVPVNFALVFEKE